MTCSGPATGFTCRSPWPARPSACDWRPAQSIPEDKRLQLLQTIRSCADHIAKQEVMIDALALFGQWAIGDGPLPRDEEAERVLGYFFAAWDGDKRLVSFFRRAERACVDGMPDVDLCEDVPAMRPHDALRRVEELHELRVAMGRIKLATRRALDGDRIGTIRALRGAIDVFGESTLSDYVRLQWRVAELEVEARGLADRYDGPSKKSIENRGSDR